MNPLERQLSKLLHDAAGEPSTSVDPDALLARRRLRALAPVLAALAVLAVAVPVAMRLARDPGTSPTSPRLVAPGVSSAQGGKAAATRTARALIAATPVLPGARRAARPPVAELGVPASVPGAQHVQRSAFWTAPGDVATALAFYRSQPPPGMHADGEATSGGPSGPTTSTLSFTAGEARSLLVTVVGYRGGVAVRADAQVLWAPSRAPADAVPRSVTSVEVTVVRKNPQLHIGAPTVRRALTGGAAHALAEFVNAMPRAVPSVRSCPAILGGQEWSDTLVFSGASQIARVVDDLRGCATITFRIGQRAPIQLSGELNAQVLAALGLPAGYGN